MSEQHPSPAPAPDAPRGASRAYVATGTCLLCGWCIKLKAADAADAASKAVIAHRKAAHAGRSGLPARR